MTNLGAFLLKKLKIIDQKKVVFLSGLMFFLFFFFGCKTTQIQSSVEPVDLLDSSGSFYLRIPKNVDSSLIETLLQKNIKGLSNDNSKKITERIDTVYIGLKKSKKSVDFQISSLCNFPRLAVSSVFTKKNGWISDKLLLSCPGKKNTSYTVYNNGNLLASFPSEQIAVIGRSVPAMVERFHNISNAVAFDDNLSINADIRSWLSYENSIPDEQIRFYASKPQSFLTTLTGANLNFKLSYVKGLLENDLKNDAQYLMDLEFEFRDYRVVDAAKAMMEVAFGLTDSNVQKTSDTHLIISDVKINKQQLYKLLVL